MVNQINGATMIRSGSIGTTQIASAAGITDGQLASSYLYANGTRALSGNLSMGSNLLNNLGNGVASGDAVNLGQLQALVEGVTNRLGARVATNTESLTISAGNATGLTGLTVDGVTVAIGDFVLVPNAPASTGACGGTTLSTQPANGLYSVTGITTNITMVRAVQMAGSIGPFGEMVNVIAGPTWGGVSLVVTTPSTEGAFTYGTGNNIAFTQWNGLADVTVTSPLTKSGNTIALPTMATGTVLLGNGGTAAVGTLSGAITVGNTGVVTLAAAAVALSNLANLAANSVMGNNTGSGATPVAVPLSVAAGTPAASTIPLWDANKNLQANAFAPSLSTITSAAGTSTLTISTATGIIVVTGTTTQTILLPTTGVPLGLTLKIINESTGIVTVQSSGANAITTLAGAGSAPFQAAEFSARVATPTTAANWDYCLFSTGGGGSVTAVSVASANGFTGSSSGGATPALTLTTSITGLLKGNGTAISAAAGSDITAHFANQETPSGTINGSTVAFGLAHTQVTGTEQVFLDGILQRAGGVDYTATAATITFGTAPAGTDNLLVSYWF